ncbi:hypothetical protein [Pseudogracilibacillus sp. SO30301A]|uniref:hypothetical protein n=1 Tax=Pseudogracilibacillus sp. SO30301A TaxID=3098291 RepID=UPI00300DD616
MSNTWLLGEKTGNDRIFDAVADKDLAFKITIALKENEVMRVLSKIDHNGNVKTYRLDANGNIIAEWP